MQVRGRSQCCLSCQCCRLNLVVQRQAAEGGLFVEAGEVVAGEFHGADHLVEADDVAAVAHHGVDVDVEGAEGGHGVALDAGYLHQSAQRVARQAQVVLHGHLGGILYLLGAAAEELVAGHGGHDAGAAHFGLAARFGTADGGVGLDDIGEEARRGHGPQDLAVAESVVLLQMIQHRRQHAAGTAGGGGDNLGAAGVLLAGGQGVGDDEGTTLQRGFEAAGTDKVLVRLGAQVQATGDDAVVLEALLDGLLHLLPHLLEVHPQRPVLALLHIFPETQALTVDILHDVPHGVVRVDLAFGCDAQRHFALFGGQVSATDTVDEPVVDYPTLAIQRLKVHAVGVKRLHYIRPPYNLHFFGGQATGDGDIGVVTLACGGEGAIECNTVARSCSLGSCCKHGGCTVGAHSVAATWAEAYLIDFLDCFHLVDNALITDTEHVAATTNRLYSSREVYLASSIWRHDNGPFDTLGGTTPMALDGATD